MAGLLGRKKKKRAQLELNSELPFFDVHYLGRSLTKTKMGRECTRSAVGDLVKRAQGRELQTVSLTISSRGIWVTEKSGQGNGRETFIPIYSVTYGAADKVFQNVFTIVTTYRPAKAERGDAKAEADGKTAEGKGVTPQQGRDSDGSGEGSLTGSNGSASVNCKGNNVDDFKALRSAKSAGAEVFICHAFLCRDPVLARAMVVYLLKAFKVAFESWSRCLKSEKLRERIKAGPGVAQPPESARRRDTAKELLTMEPKLRPPEETTALVDKVAAWMDKWFHFGANSSSGGSGGGSTGAGGSKRSNGAYLAPLDEPMDPREFEEFSRRMMEFSDPDLLNLEVDIEAELGDAEVSSVLKEVVGGEPPPLPVQEATAGGSASAANGQDPTLPASSETSMQRVL